MHAEKQNQNRNTELLLCFLMLHVAAHLLGVVFRVGTDIYNYQWIQRVFRAFSKVAFIPQGQRLVCLFWFLPFQAIFTPCQ